MVDTDINTGYDLSRVHFDSLVTMVNPCPIFVYSFWMSAEFFDDVDAWVHEFTEVTLVELESCFTIRYPKHGNVWSMSYAHVVVSLCWMSFALGKKIESDQFAEFLEWWNEGRAGEWMQSLINGKDDL